jgi:hypothetical protein
LLAPRPTPKLQGDPLSAVRDCLFNIFAATHHNWRPFLHPRPEDAPCRGDRDQLTHLEYVSTGKELPASQRNFLFPQNLNMERGSSSETLVTPYQSAQSHISKIWILINAAVKRHVSLARGYKLQHVAKIRHSNLLSGAVILQVAICHAISTLKCL